MSEPVHAVIFDIDGTLLESSAQDEDLYRQAVKHVLGDVRFRASLHEYDNVTDAGILLQVLADNSVEPESHVIDTIKSEFFRLVDAFVQAAGAFREIRGAKSALQRLNNSPSHGLAVATGGWRQSAEMKLATAGFNPGGLSLATSDDALTRTDIMQIALDSIGQEVASVTYYGDGTWDQHACLQLGWNFVPVGPVLDGISSFDNEFSA
jgi:beta-phosphoglucomutase-like phosphatase (HAD superfamily)